MMGFGSLVMSSAVEKDIYKPRDLIATSPKTTSENLASIASRF